MIKADTYRPIYGAHRYFARRPHNVFAELIAGVTPPGGIVLDPFAGGGVVALEALLAGRGAITKDYNPLATFISTEQIVRWPMQEVEAQMKRILHNIRDIEDMAYGVFCHHCNERARVVWVEHSGTTSCDVCLTRASVDELEKVGPARYRCAICANTFAFVPVRETMHEITSVFIECKHCKSKYEESDHRICALEAYRAGQEIPEHLAPLLPNVDIPDNNMQRESALHRKGFRSFLDFFTPRAARMNAELLSRLDDVTEDTVRLPLLFVFSASLRYTNRMVTRNTAWRKHEALEWSKPGYWTPAMFLETNVFREFERRAKSIFKAKQILQASAELPDRELLKTGAGRITISCGSSTRLDIPDESVDAIVTDPPYGSYVHYADLSNFWLAWLKARAGAPGGLAPTAEEAVVARKFGFPGAKGFREYSSILELIFAECARVLKRGGSLVLTFNNREARAWDAIFNALASDFCVAGVKVEYQPGIERYEHTAQLRRAGSLRGDFVLRLHALRTCGATCSAEQKSLMLDETNVRMRVRKLLMKQPLTTDDLYRRLFADFIPIIASGAVPSSELARVDRLLESARAGLKKHFKFDGQYWSVAAP